MMPVPECPYSSDTDSFRLRYGLYETYRYREEVLEYATLHWQRLNKGMQLLGFAIPLSWSEVFFTGQIHQLARKNELSAHARIRLQVFSDDVAEPYTPQYLIECFPLDESSTGWLENGIKVSVLPDFAKKRNKTANCKISHNGHFLPARQMMTQHLLDDVLLLNDAGNVIESAMSNLFWLEHGTVFTTPLSEGCLAGTLREAVICYLKERCLPFGEKAVTPDELRGADELFLTNGIRKVRWIREWDGKLYPDTFVRAHFRDRQWPG